MYHEAHSLVLAIYHETRSFPRDEWFGIRSQIRRAAVSTVSNIVEGNARRSTREYVNFLNVARASAAEVLSLVHLTSELGYLPASARTAGESMRPTDSSAGGIDEADGVPGDVRDQTRGDD